MGSAHIPVFDLAVVGGGFTGASLALHLARNGAEVSLVAFDPRGRMGYGLAYDTRDPLHRINVPAEKMTVFADYPDDFLQWSLHEARIPERDPAAWGADGYLYPTRGDFGRYVENRFAATDIDCEIVPAAARDVETVRGGYRITAEDGTAVIARRVVFCNSHGSPQFPWAVNERVKAIPGRVEDPWAVDAIDAIGPRDEVLIFGTGLTMADTVVGLLDRGHAGPIRAVSRRGVLPQPHGTVHEPFPVASRIGNAVPSPMMFLRIVRATLKDAEAQGIEWQRVIEGVRAALPTVWPEWSTRERRSVLRHLRPYWDTRRYRLSPQVHRALADAQASGQLKVMAGSILGIDANAGGDRFRVDLRARGAKHAKPFFADALVNCIGPTGDIRRSRDHLFPGLLRKGLVDADPLGLGVRVDSRCRVLGSEGAVVPGLYAAGPLTRSTFGEVMGVPEIAAQTAALARLIREDVGSESVESFDHERMTT